MVRSSWTDNPTHCFNATNQAADHLINYPLLPDVSERDILTGNIAKHVKDVFSFMKKSHG